MVRSIFIIACWRPFEQTQYIRELSKHGFAATFACDPDVLDNLHEYGLQGVIYFKQSLEVLGKVKSEHFSNRYVWLIIGDDVPKELTKIRYDSEITLLRTSALYKDSTGVIFLEDIYVHPRDGVSAHPWAYWTHKTGLHMVHDNERSLRRLNFKGYPLRIAAPLGQYSSDWYNGSYNEYIVDETLTELDAGIRCGYAASALLIQLLNATEVVIPVELWGSTVHNSSMLLKLYYGASELSGGILRVLHNRIEIIDYVIPIWPFNVGFTYLAERESNSNMFVEPFTEVVWWSCLGIGLVLAAALRITSRSQDEKDDSLCSVMAMFLQQDASAVPRGMSGRWTFIVLSVCAMLVHAYYTSAIVSALMSAGSGGPDSLRSLADSQYSIASEDYKYMRHLFFDGSTGEVPHLCPLFNRQAVVCKRYCVPVIGNVSGEITEQIEIYQLISLGDKHSAVPRYDLMIQHQQVKTTWDDLEYLKRKKKTSNFYQTLEQGVKLIREGSTAFHSEYNQIYPHFKTFTDDQICKLQHVDTIPEVMTWISTTKRGQYTNTFRVAGTWILEVGLAKRVVTRLQALRPACRAQLLAERVKFEDVAPLLGLTAFGVVLSLIILNLEILVARNAEKKKKRSLFAGGNEALTK